MSDITTTGNSLEDKIKDELLKGSSSRRQRIFTKFIGTALGTIPWVGGFLSGMADFKSSEEQVKNNQLYEEWLKEHGKKIQMLGDTLRLIMERLNEFPEEIDERLESDEYGLLVKKSFRSWDNADTEEKRELIRKLLTNAGVSKLVPDDLTRLFLDWINSYHEAHFSVIKVIQKTTGVTRGAIWQEINGTPQREDSLEADLFKLLIRDLSMGGVIRQVRTTDYNGNFTKKTSQRSSSSSRTMTSAFDNSDGYELTELGKHFVHYAMNEAVTRINPDSPNASQAPPT